MKVRLGDVFSVIRNGASIKQKDGAIGYPITRIETISERYVNRNKLGYADIINITKYNKFILEDEDILMSHINSEKHLAKVALYKRKQGETIIHGMNLLMLRADRQYIAPSYAVLLFESNRFLNTIKTISKKSVNQASFTVTALKDIVIQLPDLKIQEKIANQINAVSHSISLQKKCVLLLEQLVKSRFMEMFGDPVVNSKRYKSVRLDSLGTWQSGGTPSRFYNAYFQGDIDWYSAGELNTTYLEHSIEKITQEALHKSSAKLFKAGSMLVGMYDTAAFKMGILKRDSTSNQACACITPNTNVNVLWLYHNLQIMKASFLQKRRGVRQKNLSLSIIKALTIPLPPLPLQQQFAAFVEKVDKSKLSVKQSLEKLETLKKSLMQQYFG